MIMDIEAALIEARALTHRLLNEEGDEGDAGRLAELFEAIDEWLKSGGFLPKSWRGNRA